MRPKQKTKNNRYFPEMKQCASKQLEYRMPTMCECLKELARRKEMTKCEEELNLPKTTLSTALYQKRGISAYYRPIVRFILKYNRNSLIFSHLPYSYTEPVKSKNGTRPKSLREILKEVREKNEELKRKSGIIEDDNLPCI